MEFLIIILILAAMGLVVYALARGLHSFANMEPENVDEKGIPKSLGVQNKMMFARVKWQAIAVLLLIVLAAVASK